MVRSARTSWDVGCIFPRAGRAPGTMGSVGSSVWDETMAGFEERMAGLSPHLFEGVSLADAAARGGAPFVLLGGDWPLTGKGLRACLGRRGRT
jgi:hypothetical protein